MKPHAVEISSRTDSDPRITIPIPNGYMRSALSCLEEIAGYKSLNAMLRFAGLENAIAPLPPNNLEFDAGYIFRDYANLNHAILDFYGRAGQMHTARIGYASALWMIENHPLFGFAGVSFDRMPYLQAIRTSLENAAEGFRKLYRRAHFNIRIDIEEHDLYFVWRSPDCPCCVGKKAAEPICWIWTEGIHATASFVSGGKLFSIEQTTCTAQGDRECTWVIGKTPL